MARKINYFARNFADVRTELINFVRQYYPDIFNDFNDASVGMMLLELNAAVGDMLSFHTDKAFNETKLEFAQERKSILSMARTFGLNVPGKRPSVSIVDFSVVVPTLGDTFDIAYAPVLKKGAQVNGAGKIFETTDDIDFSSPFTTGGIPNRLIIPNQDANGTIINYTLTKRELVTNGQTKIYKKILTAGDVRPFLEIVLPDSDVLSVESVITLEGTNYTTNPTISQFADPSKRWYQVDALAQDTVFIEDVDKTSDVAGIKPGKFVRVDQRFITEFTDEGFLKMILGGGSQDIDSLCDFDVDKSLVNRMGDFINNLSLGITVSANQTMFIQYRVGGGSASNVGPATLTSVGLVNMFVNGPDAATNLQVEKSLTVTNPVPALGGRDEPSVEEIRNLVRYNFAAQGRAVTIPDYLAQIGTMPGEFGVPFRCGVYEEQNKIKVFILGLDDTGKLTNSSTSTLRSNIAEYLSNVRMINDFVEIENGRIINLAFEIDLFVDKQFPSSQIISQAISEVSSFMDINKFVMGEDVFLSELIENLNNVGGVLNVVDMRIFNKVGEGQYSLNEVSQPLIDNDTRQIDISEAFTVFGEPTSMFEIKFPSMDIKVRVKSN